ncbi:50S ribosomal protein L2 [Candidatus Pacearchaeota archaeon CG_4_9_14_0_2_um_filter_39_13]|nr:50S ribosomal protein L2 [Candidatus Pacearchaeota archaeon]OIO44071.1 MAG: hypothetical protein AUJ64_00425 [Candidatus Pacearchaeota archaeon CG1_02_39_14]PJC44361.1 MAG: 50S ribosomal protein L2 [Candidatus Pacearchaeota archaeon CG_4_9_14_0_2_um_filter_39_13]
MGKRIIQQARGKGSFTYRVRKKAFMFRVGYPMHEGEAKIEKIFHSAAHSAPLSKARIGTEVFYGLAFNGALEGQNFVIGGDEIKEGNVVTLQNAPVGTRIFNIERNPGDGGKMIRAAGSSAVVNKKYDYNKVGVMMPNKKEVILDGKCRVSIGVIAGDGVKQKPFIKAGRKFFKMKARGKLYPRVSALSTNAIDHPFGSGRGKRVKSKIAKRNAPPGRKVGHIRPRRTGRRR